MLISRLLLMLSAATIVLAAGSPWAAQPPQGTPPRGTEAAGPGGFPGPFTPPVPPVLAAIDVDGDGEVSAEEMAKAVAALWTLDKNADGQLTRDELMPVLGGFGGRGGPGPMRRQRMKVVEKYDQDKDGILSAAERAEARAYVRENAPARGLGGPPFGGGGPGFGPPGFGPPGFGAFGFGPPGTAPDADGRGESGSEVPVGGDPLFGPPPFGPPGADAGFGDGFFGPPADNPWMGGPPWGGFGFGAGPPDGGGPSPGGSPPFGGGPFGGGPFGGRDAEPPQPGKPLTPQDVASYPDRDMYDPDIVRTIFLEFENQDWEEELEDFRMTDVEVPARMIVDGDTYEDVGVRFRGNTSYMMARRGSKRPLNLSVDYGQKNQRLYGHRTLNLLNAHMDPSFLRCVLYNRISREYLPALDANFVRLVINGENWGIYTNEEQFNNDFVRKWFGDADGARWKAPANFSGSSGLMFLGEDVQTYRENYDIKSPDDQEDWNRLITLCRALHDTPPDRREAEFDKMMNVDQILWFLAVDNVLIDNDGYFSRASDYSIYLDKRHQRFYLISHDNNETLRWAERPGFFGGGRSQAEFDPLSEMDSPNRPLVAALLSNPRWKARYLAHVRTIAEKWLDWHTLGPWYERYRNLIDDDIQDDTKKHTSYEAFRQSDVASAEEGRGPFGGPPGIQTFAEQRRAYLLNHPEIAKPRPRIEAVEHRSLTSGAAQPLPHEDRLVEARIGGETAAENVLLYFCMQRGAHFECIAMRDDGQHQDRKAGDGVFSATIPGCAANAEVRYYVEARADESLGTTSFLPEEAEWGAYHYLVTAPREVGSPVVINEFMATNTRTVADPQGEYDDWLELYNRGDAVADLSGMYLSDSDTNLLKWRFPEGTLLPARSMLIIWCDAGASGDAGLHANFQLSKKGETVSLIDADIRRNMILDQITFGPLKEEVSFGRFPDGDGPWQPLFPTPGSANRVGE